MYCKFCMNSIADGEKVCPYCGKKQDLPELPHHLPSGTVLQGKYAVGAAIGEGGFGITYVGKNTLLDMKVAIKEFFPNGFVRRDSLHSKTVTDLSTGGSNVFEKGKKRFLDEARMLGRFSREGGIVSVHDFFEENDTAYIVMEFLEGQTLADYLEKKKVLSPEETLALLKPAMKTLEKVHKSGLIHRDISPDNIMLTDSGVKLLDFGAARDAGGEKSLSVMLKHGYAPIEQYSRKGEQGPWTDVYALCATMYKCVTGVTPDEATDRVDEDELKPPSAYVPNVGKTFENALLKGLNVRAKNRYQSVSELLAALEGKDQPAGAVIIPAAAGAAAGGAGSAPTDPDKTVYGGAEEKADPDKTVFGGAEEKADPDKTVFGGAEGKVDPDKTVFGGAEDKADPDKTVYGGAEKQGDPDKTVFGGAPQYRPDPDKTVYGGEAYDSNDARQPDKPEKKKSKKGLIIALIAAVLVIAGVMIALFAMGVFDQKGETTETTQTSANGEKPNGEKPNGGETQTAPADATASAPAGATETEESGAATETQGVHTHAFGEWAVVKQPTCTEAGSKERVCSCGEKETEAIAATGHSYGDWVLTKPATDAEDGEETKTCSVCGDKITRSVDMITHNYEATVTKPTCTEQGYTTYVCSDCGKSYVDDYVPATGHTVAVDKAVSATCTEAGKTEGSHCSVCGAVIVAQTSVPATGHSYGAPTFTWNGYSATAKRTCSVCGATTTLTPTVTNSVTKEATCAATGTRTYTAKVTVDGKNYTDTKTETIAATGNHTYDAPTFTWSGYTATAKRTCSVCGETKTLTPAVTKSVTQEPTCGATGTRTYTAKVTIGETSYTDQRTETLAKTGNHVYGTPTFTWSGYSATAKRTCSVCGATTTLTPAVTNSVTKEATCAATGTRTYTAKVTVDGKNYTDTKTETIAKTNNHNYVNGVCTKCGTKYESSGLSFTSNGSGYTVTGIGSCTDNNIYIPATYNGKPVTAIGEKAFRYSKITGVVIPDSVTLISEEAFGACLSLTSVTIGKSVTKIGVYAFSGCESLPSVTIPNGVTTISDSAFSQCLSLTSVTIPDSVTSIGAIAFSGCESLPSVTIPDSVNTINESTFSYCTSLGSVMIPDSVTRISNNAFEGCTNLKTVYYRGSSSQWAKITIGGANDSLKNAMIICEDSVKKGDVVTFGAYEQDDDTSNGKEAIEWIVLDVVDGKALLISKYALDCKKYNETRTSVTWETCTLRTWLNGTFYNTAFGSAEKSKIVSTTLTNANNPSDGTNGGKNTNDKVFLLSIDEANRYFGSEEARRCAPTDYAIAKGAVTDSSYTTGGRAACWWWLRSPGDGSDRAALVRDRGSVYLVGDDVSLDGVPVRPALLIDL